MRASGWTVATVVLSLATQIQAGPITTLNTGVNNDGSVRADNTLEVRYTLSFQPSASSTTAPDPFAPFNGTPMGALVADQNTGLVGGPWVADPSNARWISPYQGGSTDPWTSDAAGYYDYRMTVHSSSLSSVSVNVGFGSATMVGPMLTVVFRGPRVLAILEH